MEIEKLTNGGTGAASRSYETVRSQIITSLFSHTGPDGQPSEELITYIKIWEDIAASSAASTTLSASQEQQRKPRYILVTKVSNGRCLVHKAKRNTNGSFSIGKTWDLAELRSLEGTPQSSFNITLGKKYTWHPERSRDPGVFIPAMVTAYSDYTHNKPLNVTGFPFLNGDDKSSRRAITPTTTDQEPMTRPALLTANSYTSRISGVSTSAKSQLSSPGSVTSERRSQSPSKASLSQKTGSIAARMSSHEPTGDGASSLSPGAADDNKTLSSSGSPLPGEAMVMIPPPDTPKQYVYEAEEDVILLNVEEMLENFDWRRAAKASGQKGGAVKELVGAGKGNADLIEARLLGELNALDAASIHSIIESDDRVDSVLGRLDNAIQELDSMDQMLNIYRTELESMADDVTHIESQNRGLQVLTANQKTLIMELERLLEIISIDQGTLNSLKTCSFQTPESIKNLEDSAAILYQALQLANDPMLGTMAAVRERVEEFASYSSQLGKRLSDYLSVYFKYQANELANDKIQQNDNSRPQLRNHQSMEDYFGRFCGLMLYTKEIETEWYDQIKSRYVIEVSGVYRTEVQEFFNAWRTSVRKAPTEELEMSTFSMGAVQTTARSTTIKRAGTILRPAQLSSRDKDASFDGGRTKYPASQILLWALRDITPLLQREQVFIGDFLHISTEPISFGDYVGLDSSASAPRGGSHQGGLLEANKIIRDTLEDIFGFFGEQLKQWLDWSLKLDPTQVVGHLAVLEIIGKESEQSGLEYMKRLVETQQRRLVGILDRFVNEQAKAIQDNHLTAKKRKGVATFIRIFPVFVDTVEAQLDESEESEIRTSVKEAYDRIVKAMFDTLQKMARLDPHADSSGEDKGAINYHVVVLENMQYLSEELKTRKKRILKAYIAQSEAIFEENLNSYVQQVIRRPLIKLIDFVEGAETLLRTRSATDLGFDANYNKAAFKRVATAYPAKEVRRGIEALSKRVEKHFSSIAEDGPGTAGLDPGVLIERIWKSLERAYLDLTNKFIKISDEAFRDGDVRLEYTVLDITETFKRNQP